MVSLWFLLFIILGLGLCALVLITIFATLRTPVASATHTDPEVLAVLTSAQRRAWGSIGVAGALAVIMFVIGGAMPGSLGLPYALAPMIAAAGALLFQTLPGQRSFQASKNTTRSASLEARSPWTYVSKPALWAPIIATLALTGFLVFAGLTATKDDFGLYRDLHISTENMGAGGGPYPGWYYGVPLIIAAAILLSITLLAHARLSKIATFPRADLSGIDRTWRLGSARIVSAISTAGTLLTLSGVAFFAGRVISNIHLSFIINSEPAPSWLAFGIYINIASGLCLLAGMSSIVLATLWATNLKKQALAITARNLAPQPPTTNPYV